MTKKTMNVEIESRNGDTSKASIVRIRIDGNIYIIYPAKDGEGLHVGTPAPAVLSLRPDSPHGIIIEATS